MRSLKARRDIGCEKVLRVGKDLVPAKLENFPLFSGLLQSPVSLLHPPGAALQSSRDSSTELSSTQLAQHSHTVTSGCFATSFCQYGETLFSPVDGSLGDLCEKEPVSHAHIIDCPTRSPSPQPGSSSTISNTSKLSTFYTSDEPGPPTTITSPDILPIDPRLMQDCKSSPSDEHESATPVDRHLSGLAPTTPPIFPMPNNSNLFPVEGLSGANTSASLDDVKWEITSSTMLSQEKAHGKNLKRCCLNNDGVHEVHTTNRLTRYMARRHAADGPCGYISCPMIAKAVARLSKERDGPLSNMVKEALNL